MMSNETILVDTNILIYAWDHKKGNKQRKAIETLDRFKGQLCLSTQNLSEFTAVMMRNQCDLNWLHQTVRRFTHLMTVLPLTQEEIVMAIQAVQKHQMHYWDAQIWAVAHTNGVASIFTEDGPIGETIEGVTYINPLVGK